MAQDSHELRASRDMGGRSTNGINPERDLPMRYLGGLVLGYNLKAGYATGFNVGTDSFWIVTPAENTGPLFTNSISTRIYPP